MDRLIIKGGRRLSGTVKISGAKNSVLPILAATLLTDDECIIKNAPQLKDVNTMIRILRALGVKAEWRRDEIRVRSDQSHHCRSFRAPYKLVSTMRASLCVLGPILARLGRAEVSYPGGCIFGPRPIDLHLKGLAALGARIEIDKGYIIAQARQLRGKNIYLGGNFGSSVLATANVMMAATLARGTTVIENAACEPEIVDLTEFLIKMGARIRGGGTPTLRIEGVKVLKGAEHSVIPDRIEAGTYLLAGAITGGEVTLEGARAEHLRALIDKLGEARLAITVSRPGSSSSEAGEIRIRGRRRPHSIDVTTLSYPGFPTDMQAQMMTLMCISDGISIITEKIYPERFIHISELSRMGARIALEGSSAIIQGIKELSGAEVMASDLRASASLVLAGLIAKGETAISRIYHLDRGYERMEEKLSALGADVKRVKK